MAYASSPVASTGFSTIEAEIDPGSEAGARTAPEGMVGEVPTIPMSGTTGVSARAVPVPARDPANPSTANPTATIRFTLSPLPLQSLLGPPASAVSVREPRGYPGRPIEWWYGSGKQTLAEQAVCSVIPGERCVHGSGEPVYHSTPASGYWLVGADGSVFASNAPFEGSAAPGAGPPGFCAFAFGPGINVNPESLANADGVLSRVNCVGIAGSEGNSGYWVANNSSLPSAFGSTSSVGQLGCPSLNGAAVGWSGVTSLHLAAPIFGIAATPGGKGFWLVGRTAALLRSAVRRSRGR